MKKIYKITHVETSSAESIVVFYKDHGGNDVPVELYIGDHIFIEYEVIPSSLRVYEKKGIITMNSNVSIEGIQLNKIYNDNLILEEIADEETEFVEEGNSDDEVIEEALNAVLEATKEGIKEESIIDTAKKETKKYSKTKKKKKSRKGPGRPKKRGPKKGSKRKKK